MDERNRPTEITSPANGPDTTHRDGRSERGARNRQAILTAVTELIDREERMPTAERAAEAAGVGIRTIFRHFSDMDALYAEVYQQVLDDLSDIIALPSLGGPLEGRCSQLIKRRCEFFERIAAFRRAATHQRDRSHFLQRRNEENQAIYRLRLFASFPELEGAPPALVEAADMLSSFEAWNRLKVEQGLSNIEARICLESTFAALMRDSQH